ncbi:MAG: hypothetical protein BGO98_37400 [Myxococcales bacterium 68-20]|nr:MAG: hypothetical protein BGO98_37400 [Myxococcales bacterium 68-20]
MRARWTQPFDGRAGGGVHDHERIDASLSAGPRAAVVLGRRSLAHASGDARPSASPLIARRASGALASAPVVSAHRERPAWVDLMGMPPRIASCGAVRHAIESGGPFAVVP